MQYFLISAFAFVNVFASLTYFGAWFLWKWPVYFLICHLPIGLLLCRLSVVCLILALFLWVIFRLPQEFGVYCVNEINRGEKEPPRAKKIKKYVFFKGTLKYFLFRKQMIVQRLTCFAIFSCKSSLTQASFRSFTFPSISASTTAFGFNNKVHKKLNYKKRVYIWRMDIFVPAWKYFWRGSSGSILCIVHQKHSSVVSARSSSKIFV